MVFHQEGALKTITNVGKINELIMGKCLELKNSLFANTIAQNLKPSSPSMKVKKGSVLTVQDTGDGMRVSTPRCVFYVVAHQEQEPLTSLSLFLVGLSNLSLHKADSHRTS